MSEMFQSVAFGNKIINYNFLKNGTWSKNAIKTKSVV